MGETTETTTEQSSTAVVQAMAASDERLAYRGFFQRILTRPEIGAALGALAIWVFFWAVSVPFGKASGASSILDVASSPLGIMAVAVAMLMIGGEFDLSSGAATGALAIVTILLVRDVTGAMPGGGLNLFLALPVSLAAALGLGWFNGTVVNRTGLPSFIVTLGSFFVLKGSKLGFSKLIVGQQQVGKLDDLLALPIYIDDGELFVFDPENVAELTLIDGTQLINVPPEIVEQIDANVDAGLEPFTELTPQIINAITRPEGIEIFTVPPPTVDLIETNIADGLEPLSGVSDDLINVGDRGYSFMADMFSAEWTRNDHLWNSRDWFYTIGIVGGLVLVALAVYDMNFRRRGGDNTQSTFAILGGIMTLLCGWALLRDLARISDMVTAAEESGAELSGAHFLYTGFAYAVTALGAALLLGGVGLELSSTRTENDASPTGLMAFLGGVAMSLVGVWRLHSTDSAGANWTASIIIAAGMALGMLGWGMWRYHSRRGIEDALESMVDSAASLSESGLRQVLIPLAGGIAALVGSVGLALWLNPDNGFDLWPTTDEKLQKLDEATDVADQVAAASGSLSVQEAFDQVDPDNLKLDEATTLISTDGVLDVVNANGGRVMIIALLIGVIAGLLSQARHLRGENLSTVLRTRTLATVAAGVVGFLVTFMFMFLATEQGARAIGFLFLAGAAAVGLLMAVNRGRKHSNALGSTLLMGTAAAVALMAFFIRSESGTPKFRTQAFTVLLVIACVMAIWAIATVVFEERQAIDTTADQLGNRVMLAGAGAAIFGICARLMWVTQSELDASIPPAKFSVRILWFLLFTAVCSWVLARTKFGSWTFAVGGNTQAARQVGVPAARTKTQLFMLVSFAAWLVGLLLAFRLNNIQASTGDGEEFEYIIAAVVGGTMLTGGYGSTIGAAIGAFIMAMSVQGIPSSRWNSDWRFVFVGAILLLAVVANNFIRAKAEAAR